MGKTAADIEREIARMRVETDEVLGALEERMKEMFNLRVQARRHPLVTSTLGFVLVSGLGLVMYTLAFRQRPLLSTAPRRVEYPGRFSPAEEPGILKRVIWAALASGVGALGSIMAKRLAATAWAKAAKESPPSS